MSTELTGVESVHGGLRDDIEVESVDEWWHSPGKKGTHRAPALQEVGPVVSSSGPNSLGPRERGTHPGVSGTVAASPALPGSRSLPRRTNSSQIVVSAHSGGSVVHFLCSTASGGKEDAGKQ